jgi:hypothetical protein
LDRLHRHLDEVDRRLDEITAALDRNHEAILAARHQAYSLLVQDLDAGSEATTLLSRGLQDTRTAIGDAVDELRLEIDKLHAVPAARRVEDIDARIAALLSHADAPDGFRAQRGIWHDPAVRVTYGTGDVAVDEVTASIVESAHALRALHDLRADSRALDLGSPDSALDLALASLGVRVLTVRSTPLPLAHPNLVAIAPDRAEWPIPMEVDAVVCPSGARAWGGAQAAIDLAQDVLAPGGRLVLSLACGAPGPASPLGTIAPAALAQALVGWEDVVLDVVRRVDRTTWLPVDPQLAGASDGSDQLALVSCRRSAAT